MPDCAISIRSMLIFLSAPLVLGISGCSKVEVGSVIGNVTLDTKPLADATVVFAPQRKDGTPGVTRTDSQGGYSLPSMELGEYRVSITTYAEARDDVDPPIEGVPELIPMKYNIKTTLIHEVVSGANNFDFALDSQGPIYQAIDELQQD